MADQNDTQRVRITTRINSDDMDEIERLAAVRRTNVALRDLRLAGLLFKIDGPVLVAFAFMIAVQYLVLR